MEVLPSIQDLSRRGAVRPNLRPLPRARLAGIVLMALALLLPAGRALARAPDTVQLAELTWTEIRAAVRSGKTTIIIPIGGTEQSGPYIAVGKHNARVAALSKRIARALGNALVAPAIAYVPEGNINPPTSHMRFPGTISIPNDVFQGMLEAAAASFRVHGFTTIVLLGDHGGYQAALKTVAAKTNRLWAARHWTGRVLYVPEYYEATQTTFLRELAARGFGAEAGTHASLADTSLMLAVDPSMVRLQELRAAPKPGARDGVYGGDPRHASAALGQLGVDAQVTAAVQAIRRATARWRR